MNMLIFIYIHILSIYLSIYLYIYIYLSIYIYIHTYRLTNTHLITQPNVPVHQQQGLRLTTSSSLRALGASRVHRDLELGRH